MDRETVMDPAASPARPGVRRVNNLPVAILGGAVAVFLAIMAYVAAGRAALRQQGEDPQAVRSARALAQSVAGDQEAGTVPAAAATPNAAAAVGSAADPSRSSGAVALPVLTRGQGAFPPPPRPPRLLDGGSDDALLPPTSAQPAAQSAESAQGDRTPLAAASADDDGARDLHRMKWDMFKQAIRAKTATMANANDVTSSPTPVDRLSQVRAELAAAQAQGPSGSYIDKLRQLQEAGLLPDTSERDAPNKRPAQGDAYGQFAGSKDEDRWTLGARQQPPGSAYELRAGAVIPATLQTGINSDLPGQITAIVAQDVRDTARGRHVLIPQGSRLVGTYGSDVKYGQERVLVAWQRIVWPDGKALDIGAMPGSDGAGYAGFKDQVDSHFWRIFTSALLLSGITGGIAYSQDSQAKPDNRTTVSGTMAQALGQQLGELSEETIRKQMNVAPTIEIRPGYRFNVQVTKDLTFNAPYRAFDYERSITAASQTFRQTE
jgi:type IV secretion system protein VirB10